MAQTRADFHQNLNSNKELVEVPGWITEPPLIDTYKTCRVVDGFLYELYQEKEENELTITNEEFTQRANVILEHFKTTIIAGLLPVRQAYLDSLQNPLHRPTNLFELAKCENLYLSNKYTRVISESLGHYLEEIAELSPLVFNPEKALGVKILGVDIIIVKNGTAYYAQLKTKRDTLTGSQAPRSNKELSLHEHPLFVACLSLGNWTFNNNIGNVNTITKIAGHDFWDFIGINYDTLIRILSIKMQEIESALHL